MAIANSTRKKNSGILRYTFGGTAGARTGQYAALAAATTRVISCLGADTDVEPDEDDQVFGEFPGHVAITGSTATGSLFSGSNVVVRDGIQASPIVIDPTTGNFVDPTGGRTPAYIPARANNGDGHLGGAPKVHAYFQLTNAAVGASTVPSEAPLMYVQTEVKTGRFVRNSAEDTDGPLYISSIRVAVRNAGGTGSIAAGVLIVEIQHSEHDLPGTLTQDQNFAVEDT